MGIVPNLTRLVRRIPELPFRIVLNFDGGKQHDFADGGQRVAPFRGMCERRDNYRVRR
jgi:hypothetical protein